MNYRRETRGSRSSLFQGFDGLEEGGLRASSSHSHPNDEALDSLQDRVAFLKRLTGDIHEEVESHNRLLDRMGNSMDISRGLMSVTVGRFKKVFERKSNRRMCSLVAGFVAAFVIVFYMIRLLSYVRG